MKKYNQPQTEIVSVELTNMILSGSCGPGTGIGIGSDMSGGVGD